MRTQLFEHNKVAYRKVMAAFETSDRTCVVHPTGTGKSFLIAAVSESYKKVLILGPNDFVLEQVADVLKWREKGVEYMTYSLLTFKEQMPTGYDLICLDEFHRAGASEWGDAVSDLLTANPIAKILGASATPIRYLDSNRDMADELFHGNIASYITIADAWSRNILPIPRYVSGLFRWDKAVGDIRQRINESKNITQEDKRERIFRLSNARLNWELSCGMPAILRKHLDRDAKRIIVFCGSIESISNTMKEVVGWFREAGFSVSETCIMHSNLSIKEQRSEMFRFEKDLHATRGVKLMFSVNMLNEGIHIPNVNAVLMLRTTASRIIYLQQMGRCLTAANTAKPLVLDMVDNITTTTAIKDFSDEFAALELLQAEREGREPRKFDVVDYTLSVKDLAEKLAPTFLSFTARIRMAKNFCERNGRLPGKKDDEAERRNWSTLASRYKYMPEVMALRDQYAKEYKKLLFDERIRITTAFCEKNGRLPGRNDDYTNRRNWYTLLVSYRNTPEVKALREKYSRQGCISVEERIQQATEFCRRHGRSPRKTDKYEEWRNWYTLTSYYKDRPEVKVLRDLYITEKGDSGVVSFDERVNRAAAFCAEHGRPPGKRDDAAERRNWYTLIGYYKDNPEVIELKERYGSLRKGKELNESHND